METKIVVRHDAGLHARPAAVFVQTASEYASAILVRNLSGGRGPVDAKSILGVLTLGVAQGDEIALEAEGPDAQEALETLCALVDDNFGEG